MKMKIVLAACAASLVLAACSGESPTASVTPGSLRADGPGTSGFDGVAPPRPDGVPTFGSGGFTDPPPPVMNGTGMSGSGGYAGTTQAPPR